MKKIIATVLAMVMALALCTVAMADTITTPDKYRIYPATSANISGKSLTKTATTEWGVAPIATTAAASYSNGSGNIEYMTIGDTNFVKTTTPTTSDFAVVAEGKTDILFYVTKVAEVEYYGSAKAFTDFGYKCGQVKNTDNSKYYEITTGEKAGEVRKADDTGMNVLVDGKIVKVALSETENLVAHSWAVSASKVENGAIVPTEVTCAICGTKCSAIYEAGKAPAGSKTTAVPGYDKYVFVLGGTTTTPSTDKNTSPKTFDAGIAMYVGMALTSVAGSAVVIGKKKEF